MDNNPYAEQLIGDHPAVVEVRRLVERVANSPARTVLIYGETGTGKGLVARLLHRLSDRARRPFVDVNCAAIPSSLLESELFGHQRGAFTGAVTNKAGLIESADGGTIFLDEIREMDVTMQAKLLSLLDTQRFRRVGAVRPIGVDVRFVAASNRILLSEVRAGRFRDDLYYRLQVVAINIPPLRERGDDLMILIDHFLRSLAERKYRRIVKVEPEAERILRAYSWPGNVRELGNLLERIALLEDGEQIAVKHLPARILREVLGINRTDGVNAHAQETESAAATNFHAATFAFQKQLIVQALTTANGHLGRAAKLLGLTRHSLRHQMDKTGIVV